MAGEGKWSYHEGAIHDGVTLVNRAGLETNVVVIGSPGEPDSIFLSLSTGGLMSTVHAHADQAERPATAAESVAGGVWVEDVEGDSDVRVVESDVRLEEV